MYDMSKYLLSIVIPVMNEVQNIAPLIKALSKSLKGLDYEIVFVDDGSLDDTVAEIKKLSQANIKLIEFSRNFGQTSAMAAGIEYAHGDYIVTMDGDLQNDPSDIPMMLKKLQEDNLDILAGVRSKRRDGFIFRKIPSMIANFLIRKISRVNITDIGCTLKVFKSSLAKKLDLFGELHRFIPVLASIYGAKINEVPVKHHPRKHGVSKYGISRTIRVLSDLSTMLFLIKYRQKPMHLFGTLGFGLFGVGSLIGLYLLVLKVMGYDIGHRPLFFISILLIITAIQLITTGFIAELLMRTYFSTGKNKPYSIAKIYIGGKEIDSSKNTSSKITAQGF